jgi:hypothetical protein
MRRTLPLLSPASPRAMDRLQVPNVKGARLQRIPLYCKMGIFFCSVYNLEER